MMRASRQNCFRSHRAARVPRHSICRQRAALRGVRLVSRATDGKVRELREALGALETEAVTIRDKARDTQRKRNDLLETVQGMEKLAIRLLERQDDQRAREVMKEKSMYQEQLDKLDAKVNDLLALEDKLHLAIEKKTAALSNVALEQGHEFRDDAAGVSIVMGPDGKPMFQRTRPVGQVQDDSTTYSSSSTSGSQSSSSSYGGFSSRPGFSTYENSSKRRDDDISNLDDLLAQGDRRLNDSFVELERQALERSLRASSRISGGDPDEPPRPQAPNPYQPRQTTSPWDEPRAPAPGAYTELPPPKSERDTSSSKREARSGVRPEWWTMGQNALMDGDLASLAQSYEPLYDNAAIALVRIVNPLNEARTPNAKQLKSLVALSLRSPEEQGSAKHWGAEFAKGSGDLTNNTRLAVFGAGLQLMIEDLISDTSEILPRNERRRAQEGRALLVALASTLQLRGDDASDFAVRLICRVVRTSLLDALKPLQRAYAQEDKDGLDKAEANLRALHRVLRGLPSTLALANGHSAALEATDELRQEMSATDARRLDKLFRLVSGDDSSCTGLRAIVGPLFL